MRVICIESSVDMQRRRTLVEMSLRACLHWVRDGPLEKWWGGGKKERHRKKKNRTPRKFEEREEKEKLL